MIFINSCSFLKQKEEEFLRLIKRMYRIRRSGQKFIVFGCLPAVCRQKIEAISKDILLYDRDLSAIVEEFKLKAQSATVNFVSNDRLSFREKLFISINNMFIRDPGVNYRLCKDQIFHLKISDGCLGKCSYCSEKFISKLKSHSVEAITSSFEKGLKSGYKLFALNSDDTSTFGLDNNQNIYDLIEQLVSYEGSYQIAISEFNPRGLLDKRAIPLLAHPKIIYITVPIQSASEEILRQMRRPYPISEVVAKIEKIKDLNPKLKINTHVIVGFPGESEENFIATLTLMKTALFDRVKIFEYSDRHGTEASRMTTKISSESKKRRARLLRKTILKRDFLSRSWSNLMLNSKSMS